MQTTVGIALENVDVVRRWDLIMVMHVGRHVRRDKDGVVEEGPPTVQPYQLSPESLRQLAIETLQSALDSTVDLVAALFKVHWKRLRSRCLSMRRVGKVVVVNG